MEITKEYRSIYELAEELAEQEAKEYEKNPFKKYDRGLELGKTVMVYREMSRAEFKIGRKDHFIMHMASIISDYITPPDNVYPG